MGRSRFARRFSICAALVALALTASSCAYYQGAIKARSDGGAVPWWCTSTEEIPVTDGPGRGHRRLVRRAPTRRRCPGTTASRCRPSSTWPRRTRCSGRRRARPRPTDGARSPPYVPGMGTHHVRGRHHPGDAGRPRRSTGRTRSSTTSGSTTCSTRLEARGPPVRRQRPVGQARRLRLLRAHQHRAAARGLPRQQRLVAPPPVDLLPQVRRGDDRLQHQRRELHRRRAAST